MAQVKASTCRSCQENGRREHHPRDCRHYNAQAAFNARMRRLWTAEPDWRTAPIPGPSPDFPLVSAYSSEQGRGFDIKPDPDKRELYRLLESDGAAYRAFIRACDKAREKVA